MRNTRWSKAVGRVRRLRYGPLSFSDRTQVAATGGIPCQLYGSELQSATQNQVIASRRSVSAMVWRGKTWTRSPVATFTFILPGHRLDAKQAVIYHVLTLARRILKHRVDLHSWFQAAWELRKTTQKGYGPVGVLAKAVKLLGWCWDTPWHFTLQSEDALPLLEGPDGRWKHVLRHELRLMVWKEPQFVNRQDLAGAHSDSIAYDATVALVQRKISTAETTSTSKWPKKVTLTPAQGMHLRTLLSGSVHTRCRLLKAGLVKSSLCLFCLQEDEDAEHIFWKCPQWKDHRTSLYKKYPPAEIDALPVCTRQCGVALKTPKEDSIPPVLVQPCQNIPRPAFAEDHIFPDECWQEGFLVVASDGACTNQQACITLCRAGFGLFFGSNDPRNIIIVASFKPPAERAES